jgi:hypothetical protein
MGKKRQFTSEFKMVNAVKGVSYFPSQYDGRYEFLLGKSPPYP